MPTSQPLASTVPPDMLVVWTIAAVRPVEPAGTQLAASALEAPTRVAEAPTPTPTPQSVTPDSTARRIRRPTSPLARSPFRTLRSPSSFPPFRPARLYHVVRRSPSASAGVEGHDVVEDLECEVRELVVEDRLGHVAELHDDPGAGAVLPDLFADLVGLRAEAPEALQLAFELRHPEARQRVPSAGDRQQPVLPRDHEVLVVQEDVVVGAGLVLGLAHPPFEDRLVALVGQTGRREHQVDEALSPAVVEEPLLVVP